MSFRAPHVSVEEIRVMAEEAKLVGVQLQMLYVEIEPVYIFWADLPWWKRLRIWLRGGARLYHRIDLEIAQIRAARLAGRE